MTRSAGASTAALAADRRQCHGPETAGIPGVHAVTSPRRPDACRLTPRPGSVLVVPLCRKRGAEFKDKQAWRGGGNRTGRRSLSNLPFIRRYRPTNIHTGMSIRVSEENSEPQPIGWTEIMQTNEKSDFQIRLEKSDLIGICGAFARDGKDDISFSTDKKIQSELADGTIHIDLILPKNKINIFSMKVAFEKTSKNLDCISLNNAKTNNDFLKMNWAKFGIFLTLYRGRYLNAINARLSTQVEDTPQARAVWGGIQCTDAGVNIENEINSRLTKCFEGVVDPDFKRKTTLPSPYFIVTIPEKYL